MKAVFFLLLETKIIIRFQLTYYSHGEWFYRVYIAQSGQHLVSRWHLAAGAIT